MADSMALQPSSPTTLLSQSSTLVDVPVSNPHPHPSALLSLTPELLLQIISHLPTTSYHPLTRTSHGLRLFFKVHSAHICNTHIIQHFALEAQLLTSTIRDGWLVPTHRSVYTSLSSISLPKTEELLVLSEPGPHYLRFLQEYSKDILIRAEMTIRSSHPPQPPITKPSPDSHDESALSTPEEDEVDAREDAQHQAERDFTFMLSTYCVRPFTTRLNSPPLKPNRSPTPTRQVFGELPPVQNEKCAVPKLDDTHGALRWYYGAAGVKNCPLEDGKRLGSEPKHGVLGVWKRVKILVKRRKEKISVTSKLDISASDRLKRSIRGVRIRVLGVGDRLGHKLLAATKRTCLRHGFQSLS